MSPSPSSFSKQRKKKPHHQQQKHSHPRHGSSLPLLAFAGAKKTTYDPRVAKHKASALAAKRVNEFRKLKARLEAEGKLAVPIAVAKATKEAAADEEDVREKKREKEGGVEGRRKNERSFDIKALKK